MRRELAHRPGGWHAVWSLFLILAIQVSPVGGQERASEAPPAAAQPAPQPVEDGGAQARVPATTAPLPQTSAAYRLSVSDLVAVSVYQEPDLTATARISEDGTIVLPLLGVVKVAGKSVKEATDLVTSLYKQDYLVSPVVTISVLELTKARFTVMGQVGRPGIYELPAEGSIPFTEAIAMAGGYSRLASKSKITVKRIADGREQVFKVNGKDQESGDKTATFRVQAGDIITIGESWF